MARRVAQEVVSVTTTGGDAVAAGSATTTTLNGELLDIYLNFHASAPGTTDTTVSFTNGGGNVLAVSNSATDALFTPRAKPVDNANAAITNAYDRFPLNGPLTVTIAESNALTGCVVATIRYLKP